MRLKKLLKSITVFGGVVSFMLSNAFFAKADKGMWLLNELNKQNIETLKQLGFKLSVDSLYSLDKPSIANSVVIFGGGCTGVTVSNTGLIFTNHHCGYGAIQSQSSVNHDYLRDGFVSNGYNEELPIEGLKVQYLRSIEDVTSQITKGITDKASADNIVMMQQRIQEMMQKENENASKNHQSVEVVPYYQYNKFYKITYDVFEDVRMVFAPPSSLGKFGGDTDNWMYPRHTADFSVFRVYADKNNRPAKYSKDNKPYKPKYFAAVSTKGYKENDFAMTIGFPGSTDRYSPSWGIQNTMESENSPRIYVRGIKQDIWKNAMDKDQATRIKYASKFAQSSNYWKNSIGMNRGIKNLNVLDRKRAEEAAFQKWADKESTGIYKNVLSDLEKDYKYVASYQKDFTFLYETLFNGSEVFKFYRMLSGIKGSNKKEDNIKMVDEFFKNYSSSLDKEVTSKMLDVVYDKISDKKYLASIDKLVKNVGGKDALVEKIFSGLISSPDKIKEYIKGDKYQEINKDVVFAFGEAVYGSIMDIRKQLASKTDLIDDNLRLYFAGRQKMDPKRLMPSDANFTMRMSYATIKGYAPSDGAWYNYYTTIDGVLQKNAMGEEDYDLLPSVKKAIQSGNFARWADAKSKKLQTCFISSNDITGGNSGSPVFDGNGRLIGLAFDGNWEAMSGDIEFEPDLQRTISVDIRYVLWTIDVWGKCPRIIKELNLR